MRRRRPSAVPRGKPDAAPWCRARPRSLISSVPPFCSTKRLAIARPRPVPSGRVVKNGSVTAGSTSAGMPLPVSLISTMTRRAVVARARRERRAYRRPAWRRARWRSVRAWSAPPSSGSSMASGRSARQVGRERDRPCPAAAGRAPAASPPTSADRFSRIGCSGAGRENVSRCVMRLSSRSTSLIIDSSDSRAAGESGCRSASWAEARRLASGLRSPCATPAAICPTEASFSCSTSCAWAVSSWPILRRELGIDVHQLGAGLAEVAGHLLEAAGQVADLVTGAGRDRMVEVAAADDASWPGAARRSGARGCARSATRRATPAPRPRAAGSRAAACARCSRSRRRD